MRQLILLRGVMGVGKSTWVKENNLEPFTLSPDNIRTMFCSPEVKVDGTIGISQKNETRVWKILMSMLEERMKRGDFTIIDATHMKQSAISNYKSLCQKYRYRCYVVEFREDLETILERNRGRDSFKFVPENVINNAYMRFETEHAPKWCTYVNPNNFVETVMWKKSDLTDRYENILVIGDIHGSFDALKQLISEQNNGVFELKDNTQYVFCGDYLDRGTQNKEVFQYIESIASKPNVLLLQGNHERHLINYGNEAEIRSNEFIMRTLPELESIGVTPSRAREFCRRLQQVHYFTFGNIDYIVTHGGLDRSPKYYPLSLISTDQLIDGIGGYEDNIEEIYSKRHGDVVQIHGHRNMYRLPVASENYSHSINLEGQVEHGGYLRAVKLSKYNKFEVIEVKNNNYREDLSAKVPKTVENIEVEEFVALARKHDFIKETVLPDNISSFNFTSKAFRDKEWDEMTTHARGLFINTKENYVAARSYEKFFNDGERTATRPNQLLKNLQFPIYAYRKENGFLGMVSYDKATDELKFYSKSSSSDVDSQYAQYVKETVEELLTKVKIDLIKDKSKKLNSTFVFEVVLPKEDPHIIEYDKKRLFLLDVIENDLAYKKLSYAELLNLGNEIGLEVKQLEYSFDNWTDYFIWYNKATKDLSIKHEGWVVEDSVGFMFKIKIPFYTQWKKLRSVVNKINRKHQHLIDSGMLHTPLDNRFAYWAKNQSEEELKSSNIINLRNRFYEETGFAE